jgi:hypothetical protein
MTMAVRQQSPQILDSGKTVMARLHSNFLNDCGKTAIFARQQSPSSNGGASEIFSNF